MSRLKAKPLVVGWPQNRPPRKDVRLHRYAFRTLYPAPRNRPSTMARPGDVHYYDNALTDNVVANYTSGTKYVYRFMAMSQGVGQQERIGKKVLLKSIGLNMSIYRDPSSTSHDRVRLLLVKVKNVDAVTAINNIYNDIYDTTLSTVSTALQAFRTVRNGQLNNFKIVRQWTIDLGYGATDKSTKVLKYFHRFKKPVPVWYDTDSTANPVMNDYVLIAVSDTSANSPLISVASRITFLP